MKNPMHYLATICAMSLIFYGGSLFSQTTHHIAITNFDFTPPGITVQVGDTVSWSNMEGFHNVNGSTATFPSNPESFSSGGPQAAPWAYSKVFTTPGVYNYQCDVHPGSMQGTVTVIDPIPPCEDPYPAVDGLNAQIEGNGVMFSWNPVPGQIGCQFRIDPINGGTVTRTIGGANASEQYVPGQYLSYGTTYTWGVRCGCSQNPIIAGPWVNSTFTTPGGAAISSSPNPTSGVSNVRFDVVEDGHATLEVYDMNGRSIQVLYDAEVQPGQDYRFEFNGAGLPAGVYIYRLTTESEVVIEKFMITR